MKILPHCPRVSDAFGKIYVYIADATLHADIGHTVPAVVYCPDDDGNSVHVISLSAFKQQFTLYDEPRKEEQC